MARNLTQTILEFLRDKPEESFTVPTVIKEMEKAFWKGDLRGDVMPLSMRQGFQNAEKNKQKIPTDDFNRFKRSIYIALYVNTKNGNIRRIEKAQGEKGYLKYQYAEKESKKAPKISPDEIKKLNSREKELYPLLQNYLIFRHGIGSKRIEESRSPYHNEKGKNYWRYPDIVGIEDINSNWNKNIKSFVKRELGLQIRFWSFEVKVIISRSNLRECFFQAVANSSWANFGYLVAEKIDGVDDELRMLSDHHGIGFILLGGECDNPEEDRSYIKYPAKERSSIDWAMADKLAKESGDFDKCMKLINAFYYGSNDNRELWKNKWNDFWGFEDSDEE